MIHYEPYSKTLLMCGASKSSLALLFVATQPALPRVPGQLWLLQGMCFCPPPSPGPPQPCFCLLYAEHCAPLCLHVPVQYSQGRLCYREAVCPQANSLTFLGACSFSWSPFHDPPPSRRLSFATSTSSSL